MLNVSFLTQPLDCNLKLPVPLKTAIDKRDLITAAEEKTERPEEQIRDVTQIKLLSFVNLRLETLLGIVRLITMGF